MIAPSRSVFLSPPRYLAMNAAGIDITASGVKAAILSPRAGAPALLSVAEAHFENQPIIGGDIGDEEQVVSVLRAFARRNGIRFAHLGLPEQKSFLFDVLVSTEDPDAAREEVAAALQASVPLPPAETAFSMVVSRSRRGIRARGAAYARRIVALYRSVATEAGIIVRGMEPESFAQARSLVPYDETGSTLVIDIGKTSTKLSVVEEGMPSVSTTLDIGGHALTLAIQKHFGVTEAEAKEIKRQRGVVPGAGDDEYLGSLLSTLSAMRDEVLKRYEYWQGSARAENRAPIARVVLVGGNSNLRGLPEYFSASIGLPVSFGNVLANLARPDEAMPPVDAYHAKTYATAIGLSLRSYV